MSRALGFAGRWRPAVICFVLLGPCAGCRERPAPSPAPAKITAPAPAREPTAPDRFVFRPTFDTDKGPVSAGTAFAVRVPGQSRAVILTALHLLGPSGGMSRDVAPADVPRRVKELRLRPCFGEKGELKLPAEAIVIPQAAPLGKVGPAGDVVAFWGPAGDGVHAAELAADLPGKGEPVWLVAQLLSGAPKDQRLHRARVVGTDEDGDYVYRYDNPKVVIRATSGAPVVNGAGQVVAINLGGGQSNGGVTGVGNPVTRFRKYLEAAIGKQKKP